MSSADAGLLFLGAVVVVVLLVFLEGRRQARIYGKPSGRPNLAGAGMLDLQKHLQADRRVDTLVETMREESRETETDESGDGRGPATHRR